MTNQQNRPGGTKPSHEDDALGAVEGETPSDPQRGNPQGTGVDSQGTPNDPVRTGQDGIGANLDETEG